MGPAMSVRKIETMRPVAAAVDEIVAALSPREVTTAGISVPTELTGTGRAVLLQRLGGSGLEGDNEGRC